MVVSEVGVVSWDGARDLGISGQIGPALNGILGHLVGVGNPAHAHSGSHAHMHTDTHVGTECTDPED